MGIIPSIHIWDTDALKTLKILKGYHKNGIYLLEFSSDDRFLISCSLNNSDDINNINNLNNRNKKASFQIGSINNADYTLIKSNIIIYDWQTGRIIFSYVISSAIIDLHYFDFTYEKMNSNNTNSSVNDYIENVGFEKIAASKDFFKFYQENIFNVFILGFRKSIFLLVLRKTSIEIKDLKLKGLLNSDITCCRIAKKDRFFEDDADRKSHLNDKDNDKDKRRVYGRSTGNDDYCFSIFSGHSDGSFIKWEINGNEKNKCVIVILMLILFFCCLF